MSLDSAKHWWMGPAQKAMEKLTNLFGEYYVTLTSSAHFQVLLSHYMDFIRETGRTHILALEADANLKRLEKFEVQGKILALNEQGQLTGKALEEAIRARSSLLSLSWAHPLTGVIQPAGELIAVCKEHDVKVHLDVTSALGKLDLEPLDVDYLTIKGAALGVPGQIEAILSKEKLWSGETFPYACYSTLVRGVELALEERDSYALEVGHLRGLLEKELEGHVLFQEVERLPNTVVAAFEEIHAEQLVFALKRQGIMAEAHGAKQVAFILRAETTQEEILRVAQVVREEVQKLRSKKMVPFSEEDAKAKNMRVCTAKVGTLTLSLLVDEEDGVIADSKFDAFGPPTLHEAAEAACTLLLRKNYIQSKRLTADLIEKKMSMPSRHEDLNLVIDAIDAATEMCMDIPIEDVYVAPPEMEGGERTVYPNWEELSDGQKKAVIAEVMERDIRPYVELDAGGVEVIKVEENRITIAYSGNCTSCFSATGATLDAIGNILRHKIYPDLMVIPDTSLLSGQL